LAIKLNGTTIPPFVRVHQVRRPIHPPIIRATVKIPGRNGSILSATSFDEFKIYLDFGIAFISKEELESKISQLAEWLYHEEDVPLVLPGSEKYYQVQVEGETHWETLRRTGKGTITFLCTDPFRYGKEHIIPLHPSTDPTPITNPGVETYPQINLPSIYSRIHHPQRQKLPLLRPTRSCRHRHTNPQENPSPLRRW
jgi:predicted phage tail component-like protein